MSWSTIITKKGSVYRSLCEGKTQRFKRATNEVCRIQDLLCFVKFNNNEHLQEFLRAVQLRGICGKVYVVDKSGNTYDTLLGITDENSLRLAIVQNNTCTRYARISLTPVIGYATFDQTRFVVEGVSYRESHIGNDIVHFE